MLWAFTKMQGCGNDYIYFDCFDREFPQPEEKAVMLSRAHFGVGGDGSYTYEIFVRTNEYSIPIC